MSTTISVRVDPLTAATIDSLASDGYGRGRSSVVQRMIDDWIDLVGGGAPRVTCGEWGEIAECIGDRRADQLREIVAQIVRAAALARQP